MSKSKTVLAWHFTGPTLRDGRPVPADGETLVHTGPLVMCASGLHASRKITDALRYAPGGTICRVRCGGKIVEADDKLICTERTILWRVDGEPVLREFARDRALDVLHLWATEDTPGVDTVVEYLLTGDESLRDAAWAAARDAAQAAARDAARDAAQALFDTRLTRLVEAAHAQREAA